MDINGTEQCLDISKSLEKYYLSTMYALEFIFGITGNSVVVLCYILCLKNWRSGNIYLFSLSLSDFTFLCTLPLLVSSYSGGTWSHKIIWCQVNRILLHANLYTSILFLCFISIDRYLLMKYPFRNHFLQRRNVAVVVSIAIWVLVLMELLPMLIFINGQEVNSTSKCMDYASSGDAHRSLIYSMILTIVGFIIPLCIMCFFYMKTLYFLKSHSSQLTAAVTLEKPLTLVIMAMSVFSLIFTPYHIMRNVRIASRVGLWEVSECTENIIHIIYIVTRPVAFLNSVINPIFYFFMGDHFREMLISKVRHIFKRCTPCCKCHSLSDLGRKTCHKPVNDQPATENTEQL